MQKSRTIYNMEINTDRFDDEQTETVSLEVNEEYPEQIKIEIFQERRRTKLEFIMLYKWIIKELESFT